jgi:hypothetical protein
LPRRETAVPDSPSHRQQRYIIGTPAPHVHPGAPRRLAVHIVYTHRNRMNTGQNGDFLLDLAASQAYLARALPPGREREVRRMRQGRTQQWVFVALTGALLAGFTGSGNAVVRESAARVRVGSATQSAKQPEKAARASRGVSTMRQFSGYITAIDKSSITVEKRGKKPETRVFVKLDEMRTTGDVAKDAHVTVYYRDDGGKAIAHRVVVKPARPGSKSRE